MTFHPRLTYRQLGFLRRAVKAMVVMAVENKSPLADEWETLERRLDKLWSKGQGTEK